ncbi:hypothetical protein ATK30_7603 [Amycolatopsis echigonensis]|uniref:Uncharacterized protein n=1 Tax=Amycolatopsis echigonensis TaxID=2576905 RepID=A0A2N3WS19_9PSEU|nr:hypothetical protein ATK30_7603 [Amycolatopsis niigatensis]
MSRDGTRLLFADIDDPAGAASGQQGVRLRQACASNAWLFTGPRGAMPMERALCGYAWNAWCRYWLLGKALHVTRQARSP